MIIDNAYTDFVIMVVVESGSQRLGAWIEEPPMSNGTAIMTDTDNTKERAVAYYGDIVFLKTSDAPVTSSVK